MGSSLGKLILIRHGRTSLNRPGNRERLRAWLDVPLSDEGLEEAAATAKQLQKYPVERIFCSSLRRALQTAEALRQQTGVDVVATKNLRPWNLGAFGGQKVSELLPFLEMLNLRPDIPAPGGESFFQFCQPVCRLFGKTAGDGGTVDAVHCCSDTRTQYPCHADDFGRERSQARARFGRPSDGNACDSGERGESVGHAH